MAVFPSGLSRQLCGGVPPRAYPAACAGADAGVACPCALPALALQVKGSRSPFRLLHETLTDSEFLNYRPSGKRMLTTSIKHVVTGGCTPPATGRMPLDTRSRWPPRWPPCWPPAFAMHPVAPSQVLLLLHATTPSPIRHVCSCWPVLLACNACLPIACMLRRNRGKGCAPVAPLP